MGGLALGALGGAAGGYFLSNALNKDEKTEEKHADNETTIAETTLIAALAENSTEVAGSSTVSQVAETTVEVASVAPQNLPVEAAPVQLNVTEASTTTVGGVTDKNGGGVKSVSVVLVAIAFVASLVRV